MSNTQTSTLGKRSGHRTKSGAGKGTPNKLRALRKQGTAVNDVSPTGRYDSHILTKHGLRGHGSVRDTRTAPAHSVYQPHNNSTSLTADLEHLLSNSAFEQQLDGITDKNAVKVIDPLKERFVDHQVTLSSMQHSEVIDKLKEHGFVDIAERLKYLYDITDEDEEDIKLESLRGFATLVMQNRGMHPPQITVGDDGLIQAVWKRPRQGTLVMDFQESGDVVFALLYGKWNQGTKRHSLSGELPPDQVMRHVRHFIYDVMAT